MQLESLRFYIFLARFFPKSFTVKIFLVVLVGTLLPLVLVSVYLLWFADVSFGMKLQIFFIALAGILAGTTLALLGTYLLYVPLRMTDNSIKKYLDQQVLPTLPTEYADTMGQLMADVQYIVTQLDRHLTGVENTAQTDHLTRTLTRGASETRLRQEMEYAISHLQPFALALLDLDHFKNINDQYGLNVGDQCLKHIGSVLRENIRKNDWLGRWGGDEFILVMRDVEPQRLRQTLMRLNEALQNSPNSDLPFEMHLMTSISIGATILRPGDTPEALLAKADAALYRSKMEGQGQITILDERVNVPTKKPMPSDGLKKI
jgi:diguanylate cyclase